MKRGGLIVGITDQGGGTFFYGFVKQSVMKMAELLAPELIPHDVTMVSLTPGFLRSEAMLERYGWPRSGLFPHGGNQMSLHIAGGFGLGGAESYPGVFGPFAGFADDARLKLLFVRQRGDVLLQPAALYADITEQLLFGCKFGHNRPFLSLQRTKHSTMKGAGPNETCGMSW